MNGDAPGQGNPNPPDHFRPISHAVDTVDLQPFVVYDPSYGLRFPLDDKDVTTYEASKLTWEDASVAGYSTWYKNSAGTPKEAYVPDVKGVRETSWDRD